MRHMLQSNHGIATNIKKDWADSHNLPNDSLPQRIEYHSKHPAICEVPPKNGTPIKTPKPLVP
ncbi:hypothetical protein PDQ79_33945 [Bacillus cereus]|nr:hypothetical protein [Bacillus cereus]